MAVVKTVLKNTNQEAVVKVVGNAAAATIVLNADIVANTQVADAGAQTVNIIGLVWTGAPGANITITRNGVIITTLQAVAAGALDFSGQQMIPETTNNTHNVVVTISAAQTPGLGQPAQAECWVRLRKVAGYTTKVEDASFGGGDDPTKVGE